MDRYQFALIILLLFLWRRSDLTLVCSPVEMNLLTDTYSIPRNKLVHAPFFSVPSPHRAVGGPSFAERRDVMMIGNWRHPPNADSVEWTCEEVWPLMREEFRRQLGGDDNEQQLPELHIYGAYPPGSSTKFHRPVGAFYSLLKN
jgi:O-antigen biosynthesis protein